MRKIMRCFLCFLIASLSPSLLAQSPKASAPAPTKKPKLGTEFEFEGTTVKGERTTPMGSILEQTTADQSYDFVTIRKNWRKEILESADSLDTQVSSLHLKNDE